MTNEDHNQSVDQAFQILKDKLGDAEATPENVLEASISVIRERIYLDYYYAKPEVVEALLLQLRNYMGMVFEQIDKMDEIDEESEMIIVETLMRFSLAMRKTIDQLYSV